MTRLHAISCAALVAAMSAALPAGEAAAQEQLSPTTEAPPAPTPVLRPFVAQYQVSNHGNSLGTATMQVVALDDGRWRVDLAMKGGGLLRVAGLNVEQSTVFDVVDGRYRPLGQSTVKRVFLSKRRTTGGYDWAKRTAQWTGDVKDTRRAPVPLQDGDMSGLLINLAIIRDATPGATLHYRFVDDGRARPQDYAVAAQTQAIQVGDLSFDALRVDRSNAGSEQTSVWVAPGVPTPLRMLQSEGGETGLDLVLVGYQ
ncbi:DUF3108 domain-containing protein [Pseudoluteimonas lycopersici]|uniref:DUF3108 domain-containing protein n=1 Tax=Pseudoluteimonas lycopersici TaxID=1324796 RepID=A0A516V4Q1_9GAMM|nr:DUF3108 domain-containing protein [Lysobacter lycopersici]QDQ73492.1 DUF3108 domain-containing protein [Lysobacter lycopersici]